MFASVGIEKGSAFEGPAEQITLVDHCLEICHRVWVKIQLHVPSFLQRNATMLMGCQSKFRQVGEEDFLKMLETLRTGLPVPNSGYEE